LKRRSGFTLTEVVVALAVASCFLLVISALEVTSVRYLDELRGRQAATLILQDTLNQLHPLVAKGTVPKDVTYQLDREGYHFTIKSQISSAAPSGWIKFSNSPKDASDLQVRDRFVKVTVSWPSSTASGSQSLEGSALICRTAFENQ
jgi:prepilin-type N-terminal cleavage/methylation domain-containing protein